MKSNGGLQKLESSPKRIENPSQPISVNDDEARRNRSPRFQPEKRMFTMREASIYSGLSRNRLRELVWRGELPFLKSGEGQTAGWRLDKNDLDEWIQRNKLRHDLL